MDGALLIHPGKDDITKEHERLEVVDVRNLPPGLPGVLFVRSSSTLDLYALPHHIFSFHAIGQRFTTLRGIGNLPLRELDLRSSRVEGGPLDLGILPRTLEVLHLDNTWVKDLSPLPPSLLVLTVAATPIETLGSFEAPRLHTLDVSNTFLFNLSELDRFGGSLRFLYMRFMREDVGDQVPRLAKVLRRLEHLDLECREEEWKRPWVDVSGFGCSTFQGWTHEKMGILHIDPSCPNSPAVQGGMGEGGKGEGEGEEGGWLLSVLNYF